VTEFLSLNLFLKFKFRKKYKELVIYIFIMRANLFNRLEKSFLSTKKILLVLLIFSFLAFLVYSEECLISSAFLEIRNSTGEIDPENNNLVCGEKTKFNITVIGRQQNCKLLYLDIYINDGIIISNKETSVSDKYYVYSYWLWNYEYNIPPSATSLTFKAVIKDENGNTLLTLKKQIKVKCQSQCTFQSISATPNSIDCNSGDNFNIEISLSDAKNCNGKRLEIKNGTFSKSCTLDSNNRCTVTFTKSELKQQGFDGQVIFDVYIDNQKTDKQVSITFRNCQAECPLGSSCANRCDYNYVRVVGSCSLGVCCASIYCRVEGEECNSDRDCCSGYGLKCINGVCKKEDCVVENLKIDKFTQLAGSDKSSCNAVRFEINISGTQRGCHFLAARIFANNNEVGKIPCTKVGNTFYCYRSDFIYSLSQPGNIRFDVKVLDKTVSQNVYVNCEQSSCQVSNVNIEELSQKDSPSCGSQATFHIKVTGKQQNCNSLSATIYVGNNEIGKLSCNIVGDSFNCEGRVNYVVSRDKQQITFKAVINNQEASKSINAECYLTCTRGDLSIIDYKISPSPPIVLSKNFFDNQNENLNVDIELKIKDNSKGNCPDAELTVKVKEHKANSISFREPFNWQGNSISISLPAGKEKTIKFSLMYSSQKIKELYSNFLFQDNVEIEISSKDRQSKNIKLSIGFRSDENAYCIYHPFYKSCKDGLVCLTSGSGLSDINGKCYDPGKFSCQQNRLYYNNSEIEETMLYDRYEGKPIWAWYHTVCCDNKEFCNGFNACGVEKRSYCMPFTISFEKYEDSTKCGSWLSSQNCAKIHLRLDGTLKAGGKIKIKCVTTKGREFDLVESHISSGIYDSKEHIIEITGTKYDSREYCRKIKIEFNDKFVDDFERSNVKEDCKITRVSIFGDYEIKVYTIGNCKEENTYPYVSFYSEKTGKLEIYSKDCPICLLKYNIAQENPLILTLNFHKVLKPNGYYVKDLGNVKIIVCPKKDVACDTFEGEISEQVSSAHSGYTSSISKIDVKELVNNNNLRVEVQNPKGVNVYVPLTSDMKLDLENTIGFGKRVKISICNKDNVCVQKDYIIGTPESFNLKKGWNLCYVPFGGTRILLEKNKNDIIGVFYLYDKNKWIRYLPLEDEFALTQKGRKTQINFEEYEEKVLPYYAAWVYSARPLTINSIEIKDYEIEIQPNKWYILGIRNIRNISVSVSIGGLYLLWYVNDKGYLYDAISNRVWEKICNNRIGRCEWREVIEESAKENILSIGNPCKAYFVIAVSERVKDKIKVMFGT